MRLSIRRHKRLPSTAGVPAAALRYYEENSGGGGEGPAYLTFIRLVRTSLLAI